MRKHRDLPSWWKIIFVGIALIAITLLSNCYAQPVKQLEPFHGFWCLQRYAVCEDEVGGCPFNNWLTVGNSQCFYNQYECVQREKNWEEWGRVEVDHSWAGWYTAAYCDAKHGAYCYRRSNGRETCWKTSYECAVEKPAAMLEDCYWEDSRRG